MITYLLDTNIVTYIVTSRSPAARRRYMERLIEDRIAISAVTEGEILFGMARQSATGRSFAFMHRFLAETDSLPWNSRAADVYGELRASLASTGRTLGSLDLLIAAHAISLGAVLVTHDKALLRLRPSCLVEDWVDDL